MAGLDGILRSDNNELDKEQIQNKFRLMSNKLKNKEYILSDFVKQTELSRDRNRESISITNRSLSQKIVQASNYIDKNKEMLYNSTIALGNNGIMTEWKISNKTLKEGI